VRCPSRSPSAPFSPAAAEKNALSASDGEESAMTDGERLGIVGFILQIRLPHHPRGLEQ
jgi:hypothetical protein